MTPEATSPSFHAFEITREITWHLPAAAAGWAQESDPGQSSPAPDVVMGQAQLVAKQDDPETGIAHHGLGGLKMDPPNLLGSELITINNLFITFYNLGLSHIEMVATCNDYGDKNQK